MIEKFFIEKVFDTEALKKGFQIASILVEELKAEPLLYDAAILDQLFQNKKIDFKELTNFDEQTLTILKSIKKIKKFPKEKFKEHIENYIKLILTSAEDIRAIFIIIAEALYLIRNLNKFDKDTQKEITETIKYLYLPISHRLGLYRIKKEFEERIMLFEYPEIYYDIKRKLALIHNSLNAYIENFITEIEKIIKPLGYKYRIKGRVKSISSIWKKMQIKNVDFEEIFDILAIRIILDIEEDKEIAACWEVFSIITDKFPYHPKRLRDWLTVPKSNGYMSLHLTVLGPQKKWVEIQIRSERMDEIAEGGIAAHWKYKEYSKDQTNKELLFDQIRKALQSPVSSKNKPEIYTNEIYVFTPAGDLVKLPKEAIVLDFAYAIHSDLGNSCIGAEVNDKFVSYYHTLQNGDKVKIITAKDQKPKKEWLKIVKSQKAAKKIKQFLLREQYKWIQIGREKIQRKFERQKLKYTQGNIAKIIKILGYKTASAFFEDIGANKFDISDIDFKEILYPSKTENQNTREIIRDFIVKPEYIDKLSYIIKGEVNLDKTDYKVAKCCNPKPGETVIVLKTLSGLVIHRKDCKTALLYTQKYPSDRYFLANWIPRKKNVKLLKVKFQTKNSNIQTNNLKNILKELNIPIYRVKIFRHKRKKLVKIFFITKPLGEKQRLEVEKLLNNRGFLKIKFIAVQEKI